MNRHLLAAVLLMLSIDEAPSQKRSETDYARFVSRRRLIEHVRQLVNIGNRQGGSASGDAAAAYVMDVMRSNGLDVAIEEDPERPVYRNERWHLRVESPRRLRRLIRNEWLSGFSPTAKSRVSPLRFLPAGETIPEYLDSAVVLTERPVTGEFYEEVVGAGGICILSYAPADSMMYSDWAMVSDISQEKKNAIPVFNISYRNGIALRKELEAGETIRIRFMAKTSVTTGKPKTVVGTIRGESDQFFIVCAHGDSDSGGPGADDNASGVAGVLEIGRILKMMVQSGMLPRPHKGIRFIVWGSEYYSSSHYVRRHKAELDKIAGVLNFDQIGAGVSRNCIYFESNDVQHNAPMLRVLERVGEEYAGRRGFWPEATTNPSQGGTDSYVFLPDFLDRLDVPAVEIPASTIFTAAWNAPRVIEQTPGWTSKAWKGHPDSVTIDFSPYYHSSLDIPERTTEREPSNMVWAAKAVGISLLRLAWQK